jgi:hypothetical protein
MSRLSKIALTGGIILGLVSLGVIAAPMFISSNQGSPAPTSTDVTSVPKDLESFYSQKPLWSDCEGSNSQARCGDINVPLNWDKPAEGTIKIAVAISPAANPKNAPYLLMNPGGPGASGREWITENINSLGTDK